MTAANQSPQVAWGLRAMTIALKARDGGRVPFADLFDLAQLHTNGMGDDHSAACAMIRFMARMAEDPVAAGGGFYQFLREWGDASLVEDMDRTEAAMGEIARTRPAPAPPPAPVQRAPPRPPGDQRRFDWQDRADTGID